MIKSKLKSERESVTQKHSPGLGKTELRIKIGAVLQHKATFAGRGDCAEQVAMGLQRVVVAHSVDRCFRTPHVQICRGERKGVVEVINGADLSGVQGFLRQLGVVATDLIIGTEPHRIEADHAIEFFTERCLIGDLDITHYSLASNVI